MTTASLDPARPLHGARGARRGHAFVNGRRVEVEWTARAERALREQSSPVVADLVLHFSCLVKKSVIVRDDVADTALSWVDPRLAIRFRAVTSVACAMETAMLEGGQPLAEIAAPAARRIAPKRLALDYRDGRWQGEYWL